MRISDWSSDVCSSDLREITESRYPSRTSPRGQRVDGDAVAAQIPALGMMLARLFQKRCAFMGDEKIVHVGGVILLVGEDVLEHDARRGIVVAEIADQLLIMFDHQALGDQTVLEIGREMGRER